MCHGIHYVIKILPNDLGNTFRIRLTKEIGKDFHRNLLLAFHYVCKILKIFKFIG